MLIFTSYLLLILVPSFTTAQTCLSTQLYSLMTSTCICKPSHYLPDNDYTCQPRKSLKIDSTYSMILKTFGRFRPDTESNDWSNNFVMKIWVKHLYCESNLLDSIIVKRGSLLSVKRLQANGALEVTLKTDLGDSSFQTPASSVLANQWTHVMLIHRDPPKPFSIYIDQTKHVDSVPVYGALSTTRDSDTDSLLIGYNVGLVANLRFFKDIEINENFIHFYIYQNMDQFKANIINGWDFQYSTDSGWRSVVKYYSVASIPTSGTSWIENDYPTLCDQKDYFYVMNIYFV